MPCHAPPLVCFAPGGPLMTVPTSASATVTIDASPALLYDLTSDVTRMGEWSPECTSCEWIDTPGEPGSRFLKVTTGADPPGGRHLRRCSEPSAASSSRSQRCTATGSRPAGPTSLKGRARPSSPSRSRRSTHQGCSPCSNAPSSDVDKHNSKPASTPRSNSRSASPRRLKWLGLTSRGEREQASPARVEFGIGRRHRGSGDS